MAVYVPLPGSKRLISPNSRPAGPIDPSEIASVTVRVRSSGDPAALAKLTYDLANTPMAQRKYLTHEELERQQGAAKEDLDKIEHFAQQHDLTVVHRSAAERSVVLKGKLGDLLAAFHADVQLYHHPSGTYRGRRGEILLPQEATIPLTKQNRESTIAGRTRRYSSLALRCYAERGFSWYGYRWWDRYSGMASERSRLPPPS